MKTTPETGWSLDTTTIKRLESFDSFELKLRVPSLIFAVIGVVAFYGTWILLPRLMLRLVLLGTYLYLVSRLPDQLTRRQAGWLGALVFVDAFAHSSAGAYIWIY
jgi:uncharacterized membrane protein YqhA